MMERLLARGEELANELQQKATERVAGVFRELVADASVEIQDGGVVVSGRDMLKRWLLDPTLRFFGGFK